MKTQANHSGLSRRDFLTVTTASVGVAGIVGVGCMQENKRETKMLSMCGLDCAVCPANVAYRTDDETLRVKTADEWSQQFHAALKPADINCVGCLKTRGVQIAHCGECEIRKCGLKRKVNNCAMCDDYPCQIIGNFIANVPPAKANLEEVRRTRQN
jgi:hypothetical protein